MGEIRYHFRVLIVVRFVVRRADESRSWIKEPAIRWPKITG